MVEARFGAAARRDAVERAFGPAGHGAERVARELGVAASTVYRWAQRGDSDSDSAERLVAACQELVRTRRYEDLAVREVARAAGVAPRTAFNRFPTKEALFAAAVHDAGEQMVAAMSPAWGDDQDPLQALTSLLLAGLHAAITLPAAYLLFADLGVPPAEDVTSPWHEAMVAGCRHHVERLDATVRAADGDSSAQAEVLVSAARALNRLAINGFAPDLLEAATARLPRLLSP